MNAVPADRIRRRLASKGNMCMKQTERKQATSDTEHPRPSPDSSSPRHRQSSSLKSLLSPPSRSVELDG